MHITIKKATAGDAGLLAQAILKSSRAEKKIGIFDLIFETNDDAVLTEKIAELVVTETKCYCHYSNFLLASGGQKMSGTICGYEPRVATRDVFTKALSEVGVDAGYIERIATYLLVEPEIDRRTWVLDFMTVTEGCEPLPVFAELLKKSLLTARLKGYRKAQTMIEIGSSDTEILYEKLGFEVIDEKRSELYDEQFGRPGIMRLQMAL